MATYYVSSGIVSSGLILSGYYDFTNYVPYYDEMHVLDGGTANSTTVNSGGTLRVSSGGVANSTTVNSGGYLQVSSGGTANSTTVNSGGDLYVSSGGVANSTTVNSGGTLRVSSGGSALNVNWIPCVGDVHVYDGGYITYTSQYSGVYYGSNNILLSHTASMDGKILSGYRHSMYVMSGGVANSTTVNFWGYVYVSSGGVANYTTVNSVGWLYVSSGGVANSTTVNSGGHLRVYSGSVANSTTVNSVGYLMVSSGGVANSTTVNFNGYLYVSSGGVANSTTVNSGGWLYVFSGGTHKGSLHIDSGASVIAYAGGIIDFTVAGRTAEEGYLINNLSLISAPTYTITVDADQAAGTYLLAQGASSFGSTISIGTEAVRYGSITVNGADFTYNGKTYSLDRVGGNLTLTIGAPAPVEKKVNLYSSGVLTSASDIITGATLGYGRTNSMFVSSGGLASMTTINSRGSLHVYRGGITSQTTVNQSGYLGIGGGAAAYDTTIGYAGELTVWGGGVVSRNTIDTWGAIILSSGALAKDTIVNSLGGLHVYNGAVASNTTIKEGGMLGAGYGATVYETKLDSFGKATLWGGATANTTSIGYAGELTVLSGGYTNGNIIDTWGAIILSSGAVGNSTTILASGGYHIYNGAVAYTTMVTSGAQLGIGLGGTVYNLDIQTGAKATFYDGSILRGWSDFAGTVTVNAGVDAAGSMINFDIRELIFDKFGLEFGDSTAEILVSNAAGITGASFFITLEADQAQGRYYLAGNAGNISEVTIVGTSTILEADGEDIRYNNMLLSLGHTERGTLYLDLFYANSTALEDSWDDMALGSWDEIETGAAATLTDGAEEKKENGFLAIA